MEIYTFNEVLALVSAVAIGSFTYISFVWKKNTEKITLKLVVTVLIISLFFTYLASEISKKFSLGGYRTIILPAVAFFSQWIGDWLFIRRLKIFDAGLKRATGIDLTDKNEKDETDIQELGEGENNL